MIFVCWRRHFTSSSGERERIFQRRHERAALRVQHGDRKASQSPEFWIWDVRKIAAALSRRAGRIIQRAQKTFFVRQQFHDFLLIPQMVAGGDDVHACRKSSPAILGVMPEPPAEFSPLAMTKSSACCSRSLGSKFRDRAPARLPHDVADEKQFHGENLTTKYAKDTKESDGEGAHRPLNDKPRFTNLPGAPAPYSIDEGLLDFPTMEAQSGATRRQWIMSRASPASCGGSKCRRGNLAGLSGAPNSDYDV